MRLTTDEKLFHQEIPTSGSRLITDCSPVSPEQRAAHEEAIKSMKAAVRKTLDVNGEDLMMDAKRADALTRIARDLFPCFGSYDGVIEALVNRGVLRKESVDQLDIKAIQRGFDYEMQIMIKETEIFWIGGGPEISDCPPVRLGGFETQELREAAIEVYIASKPDSTCRSAAKDCGVAYPTLREWARIGHHAFSKNGFSKQADRIEKQLVKRSK